MSSGQTPRDQRHFPRMKIRGHRRRIRAERWRDQVIDRLLASAIEALIVQITGAFAAGEWHIGDES